MLTTLQIAQIVHEANRAYCQAIGEAPYPAWSDAPPEVRDPIIAGVEFRLNNPGVSAADQHQEWLRSKEEDGWTYGPVKDLEKKTHPCMVRYADLPVEQQVKDSLFGSIVDGLRAYAT